VLIFLDVETTGLESDDRVCSIGLIAIADAKTTVMYELVNEAKKISSKASSVNHITNEMIADKLSFEKSEIYDFLQKHNTQETTIIAHNIHFDLAMLLASGFSFKGQIVDTLRVSKHLIPECESYSLQFLRYELKLYKNEKEEAILLEIGEIVSHNALSDALFVKLLYNYLLESSSHDELARLSFENVLLLKFEFGKYQGRYIEEIAMNDRGYLEWMLSNIIDLDDDLRYSISYYLEEQL